MKTLIYALCKVPIHRLYFLLLEAIHFQASHHLSWFYCSVHEVLDMVLVVRSGGGIILQLCPVYLLS